MTPTPTAPAPLKPERWYAVQYPWSVTLYDDANKALRKAGNKAAVVPVWFVPEDALRRLVDACDTQIQTIEQLVPEASVARVADVVLFQGREALTPFRALFAAEESEGGDAY